MSGPALPWANDVERPSVPDDAKEAAEAQAKEPCYLTLETAGLAAAARLEVKWQVEPDGAEPYVRWWGATVVGPSNQQNAKYRGAPVYEVVYDAEEDFEQEHCHVIFTSEHTLHQLDTAEGELSWRREGDEWNDEEEDEEEDTAAEGDTIVTMGQLRAMVENESEYLDGKTLEEAENEALAELQPNVRLAVAAGFRDFADGLVSFLNEKMANSEGGQVTVTEEHVRDFAENFKKRQRTG